MKLYSKLALLFVGVMAFTACSNDDDYSAGEWDGPANASTYVYFLEDEISSNEILDPSDATIKTFSVQRKDKTGELTVKFTVLENTDSVFTVSDAVFADGDSVTTFTVSFPKAEMDKTYKLSLQIGSTYNSSYASESTLFGYSFLIEKWDHLGIGLYTDDIVGPLFGADPISYEVEVLEKSSQPGLFRVVYPYGEVFPYNEPGDWDNSKTYYLEINAMDPTAVYFFEQDLGVDWGYGMMAAVSNAGRYVAAGNSIEVIKANGIEFGTLVDGVITFPVRGIIAYDADGGYYANTNGAFELVLPEAYAATVKAHRAPAPKSVVFNRVKTAPIAVTK